MRDGVPGTAVVKDFERRDFADEHTPADSNATEIHLADYGIGTYTDRFELDVTLDGSTKPYTGDAKFAVPPKPGDPVLASRKGRSDTLLDARTPDQGGSCGVSR